MALTQVNRPQTIAISEQELVSATRAGDDRAFEELYARYRERISAFILSRVHDHARAEDIAQDVFISALRRLRETDQRMAFKPWLYEIAKNACIDEFRRGSRFLEVPLETDGEFVTDRSTTLSAALTPPAAAERREQLRDLRGAFGGLSHSHHQMLVMREFEGLSYDEIGERLQMSRQMVESALFRARRKLNEEYQELASGRRCVEIQTAIAEGRMDSAKSLGLKDRRRYARHLAHCQACRQAALVAGVDQALVKPRSVAGRIAALLPFPFELWRWPWDKRRGGGSDDDGPGRVGLVSGGSGALGDSPALVADESALDEPAATGAGAHLALVTTLQRAATVADSAGQHVTLGRAATAAAALAIAGAGGGIVHGLSSGGDHSHSGAGRARTAAQGAGIGHQQYGRSGGGVAGTPRAGGVATGSAPGASGAAPVPSLTRSPTSTVVGSGSVASRAGSAIRSSVSRASGNVGSTVSHSVGKVGTGTGDAVKRATAGAGVAANRLAAGAGNTVNHVSSDAGNAVKSVGSGAGNAVSGVGSNAGGTVKSLGAGAGSAVQGAGSTVGSTAQKAGSQLGGTVSNAGSAVGNTAGNAGSAVGNTAKNAGSAVGNTAKNAGSAVGGATTQAGTTVGGAAKSAGGVVGSTAKTVTSAAGSTATATGAVAGGTAKIAGTAVASATKSASTAASTATKAGTSATPAASTSATTAKAIPATTAAPGASAASTSGVSSAVSGASQSAASNTVGGLLSSG